MIVCGMETLAHTVSVDETPESSPPTVSRTEVFAFDDEGYIVSWRVFEDEPQSALQADPRPGRPLFGTPR
jgi:hypothetical protein